jgi:DNA-binding MarR family transcriptional regulator
MAERNGTPPRESLDDLYRRPGFLLRRAHQIGLSVFSEETGRFGVTTTQFGTLFVIRCRPQLDQIGLAQLLGLDRSTTALVVGKLETAGLISRKSDPADARRKVLSLTPAGAAMLKRLEAPAVRAQQRILSVFTAEEAAQFEHLLSKLVTGFNETVRTPILSARSGKAKARRGTA